MAMRIVSPHVVVTQVDSRLLTTGVGFLAVQYSASFHELYVRRHVCISVLTPGMRR